MDKHENLHEGHRKRVKKRYTKDGLDCFEDHQVLEFLLYYCYPRIDTNEIAHKMIKKYGSLYHLFDSSPLDIMKNCGVTENVAILVSLVPNLARRYLQSRWKEKTILDNTGSLGQYAISLFIAKKYECFYLILLNTQYGVITTELVHEGSVDSVPIYPRNIVEVCLRYNASFAIFAHNHPSGDITPSAEDLQITRELTKSLMLIDVEVLDHVIVGGEAFFSFSKSELLGLTNDGKQG